MTDAVELHVYPDTVGIHSLRDEDGVIHRSIASGLTGRRASMLYIHGATSDWARPMHSQWLQESAFTRLIDSNPARVVWCND